MLLKGQKIDVCGYKSKKRTCTLSKTFPVINKVKEQQLQGLFQWDHLRRRAAGTEAALKEKSLFKYTVCDVLHHDFFMTFGDMLNFDFMTFFDHTHTLNLQNIIFPLTGLCAPHLFLC